MHGIHLWNNLDGIKTSRTSYRNFQKFPVLVGYEPKPNRKLFIFTENVKPVHFSHLK